MSYNILTKCACLVVLISTNAAPAGAQLAERARDYVAMVDAETGKSTFCKAYDGKPITLTAFDTLTARLKAPAPKGEYETSEQYRARQASRKPTGGPVAVAVPLDRAYLRYDADARAILVLAGAIRTGNFNDAVQANIGAEIAMISAKARLGNGFRVTVPLPGSERTIRAGTARNVFGATIKTADVERTTRALSLVGSKLFPFAHGDGSMVTGVPSPIAQAPAMKAALRGAIVIEPESPFLINNRMPGAAATNTNPIHYTELSTIVVARPRCALVLDGQSRVVASVDVGDK